MILAADTIDFKAPDIAALRAAAEGRVPRLYAFADGRRLEELAAGTGTFRVLDQQGRMERHVTERCVTIFPTLQEQRLAVNP